MIVVRNVFELKLGKSKDALAVFKEAQTFAEKLGIGTAPPRLLMDYVSSFYTLIFEQTFASLAEYESSSKTLINNPEWENWRQKALDVVDSSYREILTILE